MAQTIKSKSGINDLVEGSGARSLIEAAAMSDFKSQNDIMNALSIVDIDKSTGQDLDNIAASSGIARPQATASVGNITVYRGNFDKISSKIYQGTQAPASGSVTINIADGSTFPASGAIYLGRGTDNYEGPLSYTSITLVGSYYQMTLTTPTTKNHNIGESVILSQGGNQIINAGELVQTATGVTGDPVTYRVVNTATILDGESEVTAVSVVCTQVGTIGNVAAGAIVEFTSEPYPGIKCTNPLVFVSGADIMSDAEFREYIKRREKTRVRGTDLAIIQASIGVTSEDDNKTVTSAQIRKPANNEEPSALFIDDSTGYNPIFAGQGFEQIVDNANGGELYFQLQKEDLTKALLISANQAPFAISSGMTLSFSVGGVVTTHLFSAGDFATEGAADTFEVINSINDSPNIGFSAIGYNNNKQIVIFGRDFKNEEIQNRVPTFGVDANDFIKFSDDLDYTLRLYKNEELLYKDGIVPTIYSTSPAGWGAIANGDAIQLSVDGISQTVTFVDADFLPYGYPTVSQYNSLDSWVGVFNDRVLGITATSEGGKIKIVSNRGANDRGSLEITGGDLVSTGLMFTAGDFSQGAAKDYSLNRSTGQIQLASPLAAGDVLTAGSRYTQGFVDSIDFPTSSTSLSAAPAGEMYFIVDSPAQRVSISPVAGASISVTNPSTNVWRFTGAPNDFLNVTTSFLAAPWLVVPNNGVFSVNNTGSWKVIAVGASKEYIDVYKTSGTIESVNLASNDDMVVTSSTGLVYKALLPTGTVLLSDIVTYLDSQDLPINAAIINGVALRLMTKTLDPNSGSIYIAGQNITAKTLGFDLGVLHTSRVSHIAQNRSQPDGQMIEFQHAKIAAADLTSPYTTVTAPTAFTVPKDRSIAFLNPYQTDSNQYSSNKNLIRPIENYTGAIATIEDSQLLAPIKLNDRYYISCPIDLTTKDSLAVIMDGNPTSKTFDIKLARRGVVYNSSGTTTFKAYDADYGPTGNWAQSFGDNFDFSNFKVHFKARYIVDPAGADNTMKISAADFGPAGSLTKFGVFYPGTPSQAITSSVSVSSDTQVSVYLGSGALRTGGSWDATTQFDVTNPGGNTWRYTYNTNGTAPNFLSASIISGDVVTISSASLFSSNNTGTFIVTAVTNTYFEVTKYSGTSENNKTLSSAASLQFYPLAASNTAAAVIAHIGSSLGDYVTAVAVGADTGIISTSTLDDTAGSTASYTLDDGQTYMLSSSVGTVSIPTNDFTLKDPLSIWGLDLNGEEFYLLPITAEQVTRMMNVFSVTGLSTQGDVVDANAGGSTAIQSELFGSSGSVQVTGGLANSCSAALVDSATAISSTALKFSVPRASISGFQPGQWVKMSNLYPIKKPMGLTSSTSIAITPGLTYTDISIANSPNPAHRFGYFQTQRRHIGGLGLSQIRIEKQGKFTCASYTGTGTNPLFFETYSVNNVERDSNSVSTITTTVPHLITIGTSVTVEVSGLTNTSFNGIFRAVANGASTLQYYQPGLPAVVSVADIGSAQRKLYKTDRAVFTNGGVFGGTTPGEFVVHSTFGNASVSYLYIENPNVIENDTSIGLFQGNQLQLYTFDSIRPGDIIDFVYSDSNVSYNSQYTVTAINSDTSIRVDGVMPTPSGSPYTISSLGAQYSNIVATGSDLLTTYAKIININYDPQNSANAVVVIEGTELNGLASNTLSSYMTAESKLAFSTTPKFGADSYRYYQGLIAAVGQEIRGDASDPVTYPGWAATGSYIEIQAALPKRIQVSIVVRNRTGVPFSIVKTRVQSVVAAYINGLGVGEPVVFSQIVSAAQSIDGIQAVSISSPAYNVANDQIVSQPNQKPLVVNLNSDIIISLAT
jgi:uncharacterized phage protein gp47/JayE